MSDERFIDAILRREGSQFTNDPLDRGGATKFGITQRAWDAYVAQDPANAPAGSVEALTEPMARAFYQKMYFDPLAFITNDSLRELVADCAVLHGTTRAIKWLQQAAYLDNDGVIGEKTRAYFMEPSSVGGLAEHMRCFHEVVQLRLMFIARLVANDPSQLRFLVGWVNRVCEFIR